VLSGKRRTRPTAFATAHLHLLRRLGVSLLLHKPQSVRHKGYDHGAQIRPRERQKGATGDARDETWQAQEWSLRAQGQESQAGDRNRFVGSTSRRRQGATEAEQMKAAEAYVC
jgi:hypothetical protein